MEFELVNNDQEIKNIEVMASIIWPITYKNILSLQQIKYMLDKYLTINAIKENINKGYTYIILKDNNVNIGFMAYCFTNNKLFLSKLYIHPNYTKKGYGKKAIQYLMQFKMPIELTVNKNNKNAIDAYTKLGFKTIDSTVTVIGNDFVMDDYIMKLVF
ncbi:MAG: GNAT family N-acetyltransferase [Anaeroplasma sp.]